MADVFISYSRRDEVFVQRLRESLAECDKDVWVDREDIGPAVEWRREIELGIEGADIFAFVITPDALGSEPCRREREYALAQNKRIVPLLRREPNGVAVPDELKSRNYIFFRSDQEFAPGLTSLLAAIDNLPEWAREHTRLLERAEQWNHHGRDGSFLLRGRDLGEAESWLAEQGKHTEPQPTPLQTEYVIASRKAATRRQRITIAAVLGALGIAVVLAIVALLQRNEAQEQRDEAVRQAHIAQSRELASAAISQLNVDPELSVLLAERAASIDPTIEADRALRRALALSHVEVALRGHTGWIGHAAFSPDGKRVVTASRDGRAALWDASTGARGAWLKGHRDRVSWAVFSPDGRLVATASRDGTARVWDADTGHVRAELDGHTDYVTRVAFSPNGRRVVTASKDATARVWSVATGRTLTTLEGHRRWVTRVEFTAGGRTIVTASDDGTVRTWNAASGAPGRVMRPGSGPISALAVSPSGRRVFADSYGSRDVPVLWDSETGRELHRLRVGSVTTAATFSANGKLLATGDLNGKVRIWSVADGDLLSVLTGHTGAISDLAFDETGARLVSASGDGTARLWDVTSGRTIEDLRGHDGWVSTAAFAPDGRTILTASQDATARIWDATAGQSSTDLQTGSLLTTASFAPQGDYVLTGGASETRLWSLPSGSPELALPLGDALVNDADISRDGRLLVTAHQDGVARLWTRDGELENELKGHSEKLNAAAFSPDGDAVVTASDDGTARIWDLATGHALRLEGHSANVTSAAFSPDGTQVVTAGGTDRTARVWDAASGAELAVLRGHSGPVNTAAFSPDGELVVTGSSDNSARIWDVARGRTRRVLEGHRGLVVAARFSPNGRFVVTASWDGTARVWDVATGEQLLVLRASRGSLADAGFDPAGRRIVIATYLGLARVYDCDVCGSLPDLLRTARTGVTRGLSPAERREFLEQ